MVAMIGGAMAKTASNSFAEVSGEGVESDGEMGFVIKNVAGDVVITISERDGWKSEKGSPYTYTHKEGDTDNFYFVGREGEESVTVPISNIWECAHNTTNNCPHDVDPGFKVTTNEHAILMYAYPEKGCEIIPGADFEPVKGSHVLKVFEVPCPNPKCDFGKGDNPISSEIVEVEPSGEVETYVNDPDKKGIKVGDKTLYPHGTYTGGFSVNSTNECSDCCADASGETTFDVCEARLKADEYIGLDRTDAGYACEQFMTANVYLENAVGKPGFAWTTGANCMISGDSDKSDAKIAVKRKSENVPGGKDFEYSKSYRQEKLSCNASLSDGHGSSCEAKVTLEGSYTVVKVDVQIEGTTELHEEERGAYTYYVPDGDSPLWQEEWTNSLKKVTITCEPSDGAMAAQTVDIKFTEHQLWVKAEDGTYEEAKNSYTVNELNKTTFYLHGHKKSEKYKGEKIVATHNNSGATDQAFYTVFGRPWLVPDYDRKNGIDDEDIATAKEGKKIFRFWINDDNDYGEDCPGTDYDSDFPGSEKKNYADQKVNGRRDLEDFTPLWIKCDEMWPDDMPPGFKDSLNWRFDSAHIKVVQTGMVDADAGDFQHSQKVNCGNSLDKKIEEADVVDGNLTERFLKAMKDNPRKGVVVFEGAAAGTNLFMSVSTSDGELVSKGSLPLCISGVNDMYRWINLRDFTSNDFGEPTDIKKPGNRPDAECNGKHVVFVHGYNTNPKEARSMSAEMFKRLWQSGLEAMFSAVDWFGDKGQIDTWKAKGTVTPEYYNAVFNAFKSSKRLKENCDKLPGTKIIMAHSLGNILACAAAKDRGLVYSKYFMINGAIAQEVFDGEEIQDDMIDGDWKPGDGWAQDKKDKLAAYRSSRWHRLFESSDFRSTLTWKNRFAGLHDIINCYSSSDEVVGNPKWLIASSSVWVLQERVKGTSAVDVVNAVPFFGWELGREAGWGINNYYAFNPIYYVVPVGLMRPAGVLTREDVITHPLFTPFRNVAANMHSTALFSEVGREPEDMYQLRGLFLSDAIPAESHSMGANALTKGCKNLAMHENMANDKQWPHMDSSIWNFWLRDTPQWYHADIKNLAYFYAYKVFDEIEKGMK